MDISLINIIIAINIMASFFDVYVFIYYRYLKSCIVKGEINNRFIKQVRLKAENCKKIQLIVDDKMGFVEKILFRQKICGVNAKNVERIGALLRLVAVVLVLTDYDDEKAVMLGTLVTVLGLLFREAINIEMLRLEIERQIVKDCFESRNEIRLENTKKEEIIFAEKNEGKPYASKKTKPDIKKNDHKYSESKPNDVNALNTLNVINSDELLESILKEYF